MDTTIQGIGREVRQRIVVDGLRPTEAAEAVAKDYVGGTNGKLRRLYESGFLAFAFREAEAETVHTDPIYVDRGNHTAQDAQKTADALVRTRYDALFRDDAILDAWLPVPGTGTRKCLREWGAETLYAVRNYYRVVSESSREKARAWERLAKRLGDKTVGEMWATLNDDDRKLLARGARR